MDTLVASAVDAEQAKAAEQARAAEYEEDLQKPMNNSVANHEGKGKVKGKDPVEVSDDDDSRVLCKTALYVKRPLYV